MAPILISKIPEFSPIFSMLYVHRHQPNTLVQTQKHFWQKGLYVGSSPDKRGAIRVAVKDNQGHIQIITTTQFKNISDGGNLNPYQDIERVVNSIIDHSIETNALALHQ
jgi:hypothetical protein